MWMQQIKNIQYAQRINTIHPLNLPDNEFILFVTYIIILHTNDISALFFRGNNRTIWD